MAESCHAAQSPAAVSAPAGNRGFKGPSALCALLLISFLIGTPSAIAGGLAREDDTLRIGVFPRRASSVTRGMLQPLALYLQQRLAVPIEIDTPPDYRSFWRNITEGRYDLVHYNQYHYVRAHKTFGHQIIARNEENGTDRIRGVIMARDDAPYRRLGDLRGRKILFGGGPDAMVSYILTTDLLRAAGLNDGDYIAQFARNPPKAVIAMVFGQADAASAGDVVPQLSVVTDAIGDQTVRILASSQPIPQLPWAVSDGVDDALREQLAAALLSLDDTAEGRDVLDALKLTGLQPAYDSDYDDVRKIIVRVLGEDY